MSPRRDTARSLLLRLMEDDSEEEYCAGWVHDNEYRLWAQVARDPVVAGEVHNQPVYRQMQQLSTDAGGWWAWGEEEGDTVFLEMPKWLALYEVRRQQIINEHGPLGWAGGEAPRAREEPAWFLSEFLARARGKQGEPRKGGNEA